MKKNIIAIIIIFSTLLLHAKDYSKMSNVQEFIKDLNESSGFAQEELMKLFGDVAFQKKALAVYIPSLRPILKPSQLPTTKIGSWDRYTKIILQKSKIPLGAQFLNQHLAAFKKAQEEHGIPPEYIAAIIGIESHYGKHTGKFPVFDTLTTLAFEPNRRNRFFQSELKAYLMMTKKEGIDPKSLKGSYSGAIGYGQFMPSNYKIFVVDFDNDGKKRLDESVDAIGSVAYYLKRHGWKKDEPVAVRVIYEGTRFNEKDTGYNHKYSRVSLGKIKPREPFNYNDKVHLIKLARTKYDELWYGAKNFYVITRYNHSGYYAMAVHQLAQEIKSEYLKQYGEEHLASK